HAGGEKQLVRWNRAESVDMYVQVVVRTTAAYRAGGEEQIKGEISRYVGGTDSRGELRAGVGRGGAVMWTAHSEAARRVQGGLDVDVMVGTSPDATGRENVPIGPRQVAETSLDKITISRSG